ncbi:autophagy-related protein 2 homolog B-like [Xyrauchen texanus]|uniref:autophagy-related protein 2 homolog B-like n=1 Tax=Xyrauchen texanus TaxID=154827 RepID=UPI0022428529|nr:autophagy-related protein 2 homolog B-like [Xyrauchen texanus]
MKKPTGPEFSCNFSKYNGGVSQASPPIISVPIQACSIISTCGQDRTTDTDTASTSFTDQPIFFRSAAAAAAETAYDMVSPVPGEEECKKIKLNSHYCMAHQPVDLRKGVAKAYSV